MMITLFFIALYGHFITIVSASLNGGDEEDGGSIVKTNAYKVKVLGFKVSKLQKVKKL